MTNYQKSILAHVLIDPDAWWINVINQFPNKSQEILQNKCDTWESSYLEASILPGYLPRKDRINQSPAIKK